MRTVYGIVCNVKRWERCEIVTGKEIYITGIMTHREKSDIVNIIEILRMVEMETEVTVGRNLWR